MAKNVFDAVVSFLGLVVLCPLFLVLALCIKLEDKGPVFYRGVRVGKHGKIFRIFKFRSMVVDAEKIGGHSTPEDDGRITRIGKVLRKYKFDELPQLINILRGEMSFVGPRPEVQHYVNMYTEEEKKVILNVRPGITDWASLWNPDEGLMLAGSPDPEKRYREEIRPVKIKYQLKYAREHSFFTDLKIIFLTIFILIARKRVARRK